MTYGTSGNEKYVYIVFYPNSVEGSNAQGKAYVMSNWYEKDAAIHAARLGSGYVAACPIIADFRIEEEATIPI